jgi:MATE family multidrug resistance protein
MLISLAGYWGLGLTSAAVFGVYLDFGGEAIWISLVAGVSVVGVLLVRRFRVQSLRLPDMA